AVRTARAIAVLADYREARERNARSGAGFATKQDAAFAARPSGTLSETESKEVLERAGISVTRDVLVQRAADVRFETLNPPLAVKIVSPDIAHKTEIGGVKLDIRTREELDAAIEEVLANTRTLAPGARSDGVIVAEI